MSTPRLALMFLAGPLLAGLVRCEPGGRSTPSEVRSSARPSPPTSARSLATSMASAAGTAAADASGTRGEAGPKPEHPPANTSGCPEGMVRVTGEYCPGVIQQCEKYHKEYLQRKGDGTVSERCLQFKKPSRCVVDRRKTLDFCMDRYEYPNELGEMPWVLTSWREAQRLCREQGKRLCSEDEFNFACEGPEMLPYVTGYTRDPKACNIDREYEQPDHSKRLLTYKRCLEDAACKAEFERLDQRHAIGSRSTCVSWAGVVDLNGNVNEWVRRPHQEPPNRSGLKGGWWGPVRNRCRPTVRFHKEFDYGYEAGFRCCKGLGEEKPDARYEQERFKISPEQIEERKAKEGNDDATVARRASTATPTPRRSSASPSDADDGTEMPAPASKAAPGPAAPSMVSSDASPEPDLPPPPLATSFPSSTAEPGPPR